MICIDKPKVDLSGKEADFEKEKSLLLSGRRPKSMMDFDSNAEESLAFPAQYGIKYIRGGEIFEVRDEAGTILNAGSG